MKAKLQQVLWNSSKLIGAGISIASVFFIKILQHPFPNVIRQLPSLTKETLLKYSPIMV